MQVYETKERELIELEKLRVLKLDEIKAKQVVSEDDQKRVLRLKRHHVVSVN
jgi:hypothetical protein